MIYKSLLIFIKALEGREITVPEGSVLWGIASDALEMISAYRKDAITFIERDDPVNSIAAAYYACGWADSAAVLGIINYSSIHPDLFCIDSLPTSKKEGLIKKKIKYRNMLSEALSSVDVAPDTGSRLFQAGLRYQCVIKCTLQFGNTFSVFQYDEKSLGWYSYGHAWADLGVRAGIFRIKCNSYLFSV